MQTPVCVCKTQAVSSLVQGMCLMLAPARASTHNRLPAGKHPRVQLLQMLTQVARVVADV